MAPFKLLYGRDPPHLIRYDSDIVVTFEVDRYLQARDEVLKEIKLYLLRAQ